jgi:hypothetical protein
VGVVVLEHLADDTGAFVEGAVVDEALAEHGVEDAALDGLQAIAGVGEGARDDDGHRVFDVGRLHDVGDVGGRELFVSRVHGRGSERERERERGRRILRARTR